MSASDDLENLDNKALRAKCLEYGLPNVPITDTSKKILIKKLRAAMDGGGASTVKGSKGRRETMHVTSSIIINNAEKEEAKPSRVSNRRTTLGVIRKEKEPTIKEAAPISEKRRASRTTPIHETSIPVSMQRKIPAFIEESDFDEEFLLIDDDIPQPVVTNIPIIRKSRSPSLSKSAVVTTSYKKDAINRQKIVEEEETEEEGYTEKRKEYNLSRQFVPNRTPAPKEKDISISTIPRYNLTTSARVSAEKDIFPAGYKPLYPTLNTMDNFSNTKSSYESSSTVTKRIYSPVASPPSLSKKSTEIDSLNRRKNTHYVENSDSNPEDEDIIVKQAPYLSDFARRLSSLKAEKLDSGTKRDLFNVDAYSRTIGRRAYSGNNTEKDGVGESIHQLWVVLDRKYKIKRFLLIVTILVSIILFIYYFYLQNY